MTESVWCGYMTSQRIESLKKIAEEISSSATSEAQIALLTRGFELFSEETERLDGAYASLREQFRAVNRKLEETNERLSHKVQELHVLTSYLDNILSHMTQGLIFIDRTGQITTYNQAAESILGISRHQTLFHAFDKHFNDEIFGYSLKKALKEQQVPPITYATLTFPDGKQKELEIVNTFIPKTEPETKRFSFTQGLILLLRDVTEFRRLQTLASRNDRMQALGEMAAQVAHEIRNPLGGIKGFASLLARDLAESPDKLRLAQYIVDGTNTLDRLVTQVLNYSRPLHLELETLNLEIVLKELKESLEAEQVIDQKIHFSIESSGELCAPVDHGLLKSALRNLLMNAIQAMPEGGKLTLKLFEKHSRALIQIIDTGTGIPQEHLKKLFSPFFTTKADGNGLGLAETHKVVQAHGGEIQVDSLPSHGTTFTIKLPLKM